MSLQVNLLKKADQRYQGIVSMKVIALGSISVLAGVSIVVFTLGGLSQIKVNTDLNQARREWERTEPLAEAARAAAAALAANRKTLAALETWSRGGRADLFEVLHAVQSEIPLNVALSSLYAGIEKGIDDDKMYYTLRLSGEAQGELTAVDTKRQLNSNGDVRSFCGEVKLVSSQREVGDSWSFTLEGRRPAEGGKQ
ncbi:MAG: hypothetical protein PWQ29_182 [Verrucomicrobiota bacterium]|jgi:hypothetical protein|nr:hypothetical protein [Verrucomicrobiota bacterium]MDK2962788.1 hypothetical protein [Verrucomicrobiota bacterium]